MPHVIEVDAVAEIVRACYSGDVTLDERLEVARRMLGEAQAACFHRLLLDFRNAQSLAGDPEGVRRIADYCMPLMGPNTRLAYLVRYDHQVNETLEHMVHSRGIQVARFKDHRKAIAWLQAPVLTLAEAPGETPGETELRRTFRVVAEVIDPAAPVSPDQLAAIGEMVQALLAKGLDEATVRELAGRMALAMRVRRGV